MILRDFFLLLASEQFQQDFKKWFPKVKTEAFDASRDPFHPELDIFINRSKNIVIPDSIEFSIVPEKTAYQFIYKQHLRYNASPEWELLRVSFATRFGWQEVYIKNDAAISSSWSCR